MEHPFGESDFWLLDVFGEAVRAGQFLFVPCALHCSFARPKFRSSQVADGRLPSFAKHWRSDDHVIDYDDDANVFWCRGRIMAIFGYQPVFSQTAWQRNCTFETTFLAIDTLRRHLHAVPMLLTDWDGEPYDDYAGPDFIARLAFPKSHPNTECDALAAQFWELLLQKTQDVRHYSDYLEIAYTVSRVTFNAFGASLVSTSTVDDYEFSDNHGGYGYFADRWCLDCNGVGEEYIRYPIRQTCETCHGLGTVNW